jgi:signal transduction histidine kinase
MEDPKTIMFFVIIATLVLILLVSVVILYVIMAKRKSDKQELKMHRMAAEHQKELFTSMISTQEAERKRIAQNMHDEVNASISATALLNNRIMKISEGEVLDLATESRNIIQGVEREMRSIINDLSPASIVKYGLVPEIEKLIGVIEKAQGVQCELYSNIRDFRFDEQLEINLYRIIKEFINNTMKYAKAKHLEIELTKVGSHLHLRIKDDGVGFDLEKKDGLGHGLNNMESRVYLLNGKSSYFSKPGEGTEIKVDVPICVIKNLQE